MSDNKPNPETENTAAEPERPESPLKNRFDAPQISPLKRALRNSVIITAVVGIVVHLQGETMAASMMTMLFTFAAVTPALWLSYRFTQKLLNKPSQPDQ